MHTVLCLMFIGQINVSIPAHDRYTLGDLQTRSPEMITVSDSSWRGRYAIQPYLQVAADLQAMPESQRVATLAEWADIRSLSEPTIVLCRMLIEKADGTPLRRPLLGMPDLEFGGELADYPDEPLLYFKGIPFFAVSGYTLAGQPERAIEYLRYALSVGRWRSIKYRVVDEDELKRVAEDLIGQYTDRVFAQRRLRRWVESQIGPSRPPGGEASESDYWRAASRTERRLRDIPELNLRRALRSSLDKGDMANELLSQVHHSTIQD